MRTKLRKVAGGRWPVANARRSLLATGHWPLFLTLLLVTLGTGCRLIQGVAEAPGQAVRAVTPGQKGKPAADPVEVQQQLLRFADEYSTRMVIGVDKLRRGTSAPDPAEILKWKIALGTETVSIAAGQNAVANLLDMTVFVTMMRTALEERWQPEVFGESARPMLESSRNGETEIWRLVGTILTPEQQAELRRSIDLWHSQNPLPESVLAVSSLGIASQLAEASKNNASKSDSVFSLLKVDPLSGLDPAVREITQTRMFAERALFVTQKMPMLLRWQTELLSLNTVEMPAVQQLVTNSTQIAASVERFAAVAEKLPGQVSTEREEILKALQKQEKDAASLLAAGTQMSDSLNTTLTTFDGLMKRFGVGETNNATPPGTNSRPFNIQDYTTTAAQLAVTAQQLTQLLLTLDQTIGSTNLAKLSAQVGPAVHEAQTGGREIVDYAFWKGILLVVIVLVAALIYRFLGARLTRATNSKPNSL
jgi:hypothetical protein